MARLYTNENFPVPVAEELRRLGHDVLTIQDTGRAGQAVPDESVLAFASAERRAVVTLASWVQEGSGTSRRLKSSLGSVI